MKFSKRVAKIWIMRLVAVLGSSILLQKAAFAAPDFGLNPSCSDRSMADYLVPLFGSLFSDCGGVAGPFETALGLLNGGALIIGGMLAAYNLVVGTMQTAHDGEMLGKKWSSMWLPIRTAFGVGLVVPLGGGYCVAQLLIGFLIGQGVGLANNVWSGYIDAFATPAGMAPHAMLPKVDELARSMLVSQVCMAAYNSVREGNEAIVPLPMETSAPAPGIRNYGVSGGAECGSVFFHQVTMVDSDAFSGLHPTTFNSEPLTKVQEAHMAAVVAMEAALGPTAKKVAASALGGPDPEVVADLTKAVVEYQKTVAASADNVFGNEDALSAFVNTAKHDGWSLAGAWFLKATAMQDAVNQVVAHVPTAVSPNAKALAQMSSSLAPTFIRLDALLRSSTQTQLAQNSTINSVEQLGNSSNPFQKGVQVAMNQIFGGDWIAAMIKRDPNRSALMSVKDFGDYLMTGSEAGIISGIAMIGVAEASKHEIDSTLGNVANIATLGASTAIAGAAAGAIQAVGYLIIFFCVGLFAWSAGIAVYLPMAPFLLYFGAFIGWIILCGEAIIAAPLWAIMHLTPEGDGVMGGARQGYMLILGLLLRPALIVLGFVFALTAVDKIALGFNAVFFQVFKLSQNGSVIGLGTSLVMIMIYFGTMVWIFHTVFGLIHVIPDKLLTWMGGGREQLGDTSKSMAKTGEAGAAGAGRHAEGLQRNMVQGLTAKAGMDAARQRREDDASTESRGAEMQMKTASSKSELANAKADAPKSTSEHQLAAISTDLSTASQIDASMAAHAKSDQINGTNVARSMAADAGEQRSNAMARAESRADKMAEAGVNAKATAAQSDLPIEANKAADAKLVAAAAAYGMLGRHEAGQASQKERDGGLPSEVQEHREKARSYKGKADQMRAAAGL